MLAVKKILFFVLMLVCMRKALNASRLSDYNYLMDYDTKEQYNYNPINDGPLMNSYQKRYNPTDLLRRITALSRKNKNDSMKIFHDFFNLRP
jgi:hypothetical protein